MDVVIDATNRRRFRDALLNHRHSFPGNDHDYAARQLKISLNTYKRCIAEENEALRLKRQTLLKICRHASLPPGDFGVPLAGAVLANAYGGYKRADYGFMQRRYVQYRRSWLTGLNVNRTVLDIVWSNEKDCLVFKESLHYTSDRGVPQSVAYTGEIYMHSERSLCSMLAIDNGEVRLTVVHTPNIRSAGDTTPIKLRGLQLAHAYPKGFFQPSVTPVYIEEARPGLNDGTVATGTMTPDDPSYDRIMKELAFVEQESAVLTPLIARMQRQPA